MNSMQSRVAIPDYPEPTYDEATKVISRPQDFYVPDPKGLGHAFYTQMRRNRKQIAQLDADTGKIESHGSLLLRSIRTAISMRNRGVVPGDVISICSVNNMDNFVPFIAAQLIGAITASVDPTINVPDTIYLLGQVNPKLIFINTDSEQLIEESLRGAHLETEIVMFGDNNKHTQFADFSAHKDDENEFIPYEVEDNKQTAVILFSSGTTGLSKGISINHTGLFHQAHAFITSGMCLDVNVGFASTYWISTVMLVCITMIYGRLRCVIQKFNPKELWEIIGKRKVTYMLLAPSQAISMLKAGRRDGIDTTSLRDVIIGGGAFSAENALALRDLLPGTFVQIMYGQSEAAGVVTGFRPAIRKDVILSDAKPASCGKAIPGFQYKIVDPETEEPLGPNQAGELRYFFTGQMNGYYNRDSTDAFDSDGWIKTGDIALYDEDYCFYIVDRIKEMLKYQAFHVTPAKIEGVLLTHPEVASAAVIGIPNEADGDHPMAIVVLKPGSAVNEKELVRFVEERVDDRSRLRAGVKFVTAMPYTPSGKIKKNFMKNQVLAGEL